jgi:hypothetical protein
MINRSGCCIVVRAAAMIYGDGKVGTHDGTGLASRANERFLRNQLGVIDPEAVNFFR